MRNQITAVLGLLALANCGGVSQEDPCLASNPDEALNCLGVPGDESERVDEKGDALPPNYSPLGQTKSLGVSSEFFIAGIQLAPQPPVGEPVPLENRAATLEFSDDATGNIGPAILDVIEPGTPWEADTHSGHIGNGGGASGMTSTRAAVATDFNGDGISETVVVYLDFDDEANAGVIFGEVIGGTTSILGTYPGADDLNAVAGDFDGDGAIEFALGVSSPTGASLFLVNLDAANKLAADESTMIAFPQTLNDADLSLEIATGNIDRDGGDEIAVVLNQFQQREVAVSNYWIFDDARNNLSPLVESEEIRASDQGSFTALVADVTIGDIDADGKGEIVFAGLAELHDQGCASYRHVYLALDDAASLLAPLDVIGESAPEIRYTESSGCSNVSTTLPVRAVFVNALDIDNDGVDEIQANLRIFEDFRAGSFVEAFAIPDAAFADDNGRGGGSISPSTAAIETADVNGDGRQDVVVFAQHLDKIVVWGLDGPSAETAVFREMTSIETALYNSQTRVFPLIVAVNVDSDGAILKYSEAEYKFVFTEPIIIAAVAGAPCADGIGQNLEACATSYGLASATTGGIDGDVSVSASSFVSFEAKDPFFGLGVEGRAETTVSASFSAGSAYSLEEKVEYTTGSLEDTVIFSTIPLDQYSYKVVSHPDPELVGQTIVVNLPRKPITLQVERSFYNQSVAPGSYIVDERVFTHTVGDIDSYPRESDASSKTTGGNGIKAQQAVTVGQGGGQTTTEITFSEDLTYRAGAEVSFEAEIAVTGGGVSSGVGVGGSVGAGFSWGSSNSTTYRGTIGSIDEANFSENLYSVGLFTYIHQGGDSTKQQFEVINYWVER